MIIIFSYGLYNKSGIRENGLSNQFFLYNWSEIESYSYEDNVFKLNVKNNFFFFSFSGQIIWCVSPDKLKDIVKFNLRDADEIRINPGLAVKKDWQLAGYKGGSEPGVLQYTHILQREARSDIYTISITVNNPNQGLDSKKITELTMRLISLIKQGKI